MSNSKVSLIQIKNLSESLGVLSGIVKSFTLVSIFGRLNGICFYSV